MKQRNFRHRAGSVIITPFAVNRSKIDRDDWITCLVCRREKQFLVSYKFISNYKNKFKAHLGELYKLIEQANKNDGKLKVVIKQEESAIFKELIKQKGESNFKFDTLHTLRGKSFTSNFNPYKECQSAIAKLRVLHRDNEDHRLDMVAKMENDRILLARTVKDFKQCVSSLCNVKGWLEDAVLFWGQDNLSGLKKYRDHSQAEIPFFIQIEQNRVLFRMPEKTEVSEFLIGSEIAVPQATFPEW